MKHRTLSTASFTETAEKIKQNFLERARNGLYNPPYPGYSEVRYTSQDPSAPIPDGPWHHTNSHIRDLTDSDRQILRERSVDFDDSGTPIHPWFADMVTDPGVGVYAGPGAYWNHGPNDTGDAVAISRLGKRILLIKRSDTGAWALPGGFRNKNEHPMDAARRELAEETRLGSFIRIMSRPVLIYSGIVADKRTTASSWAHTDAVLYRPLLPWFHVRGQDDADGAKWFKIDELPEEFFGSHRILVELAKAYVRKEIDSRDAQQKTD